MSSSNINNDNDEATRCGNHHHLDPVLDDETSSSPNNYYMSRFNEVGSSPDMSEGARRNANTNNTCVSNPFLEGTPCLSKSLSGIHQKAIHSLSSNENLSDDKSVFVNNGHSSALSEIDEAARNRNNTSHGPHLLRRDSNHLDPLRTICKKHSIALPNSVIKKLNAEQVIESGEFDTLDSARLSEIGIKSRTDRIKVLMLVKLYNSQQLSDLTDEVDRAFTRSQIQAHSFLLHQERLSLVMQMPKRSFRALFIDEWNHTDVFHGFASASSTSSDMQVNIKELQEEIANFKEDKLRETKFDSLFYYEKPWTAEDWARLNAAIDRVKDRVRENKKKEGEK